MSQSGQDDAGELHMLAEVAVTRKRATVMSDSDSGGEGGAAKARKVGAGGAAKARKAGRPAKVRDENLPACSKRTGELLNWTKADLQPFEEAPGDHEGKVRVPKFNYTGVQEEDDRTALMHQPVRELVETTWKNGRGTTGDADDPLMKHIALALAGAIWAAVQNQQKQLTKEEIVTQVVSCVPSKEDMLTHFNLLAAPAGHVQVGMWYGAQSYAALLQTCVQLGLATGTKKRAEGLVILYEQYVFCDEAFWLDLLPRLHGKGSKKRTNKKPCNLFSSGNMVYEARGVAGFTPIHNNPTEACPEGVSKTAHAKMCSMRAVGCYLKPGSEWRNKWRYTHNRMEPHEPAASPGQASPQVDELLRQNAALKGALKDAVDLSQDLAQELARRQ